MHKGLQLTAGIVVSAEAGKQQNPNQPVTTVSAKDTISAAVVVSKDAVAAATVTIVAENGQKKDNPDNVATAATITAGIVRCCTTAVVSS